MEFVSVSRNGRFSLNDEKVTFELVVVHQKLGVILKVIVYDYDGNRLDNNKLWHIYTTK